MTKSRWDNLHDRITAKYVSLIEAIFRSAVEEAAAIGGTVVGFDPSKPFSFADYPITHKRLEALTRTLNDELRVAVVNGIQAEWTLANDKNNELCNLVFGDNVDKLSQADYRRYYSTNGKALDAFVERKTQGLKLSDRVWNYTQQFKSEIEMGIDIGIRSGQSAQDMARDLKKYLKYPDKLFRRVRDAHGQLRLSKAAKAFRPGKGVYRSSYKNALRLSRTENNIAYRTSDYTRLQQLDFVVGVEVHLSKNHPTPDICNDLAGRYPKDFKFTGWHPQCRCHLTTILKTKEELIEDTRRRLNGQQPLSTSVNSVSKPPEAFGKWIETNKGRLEKAKSLPYFVRDNKNYFSNIAVSGKAMIGFEEAQKLNTIIAPKKPTTLEIAAHRHAARTPEQVAAIEKAADKRRYVMYANELSRLNAQTPITITILEQLAQYGSASTLSHAERKAMLDKIANKLRVLKVSELRHNARTAIGIRRIQDIADTRKYGQAYVDNIHDIENELGMKRGKRMSHQEANEGKVNPEFGKRGYDNNCSTCSGTYYMRRLGFDVTAKPNIPANKHVEDISLGITTWDKWKDGPQKYHRTIDWMKNNKVKTMDTHSYRRFIDDFTKEDGIYEFNCGYKSGGGHSTLLLRENGLICRIEQQNRSGRKSSIDPLISVLTDFPGPVRGIYRIDTAEFNKVYADIFKKPKRMKR